ncbi:MAG: DUF2357 domain-containing protein [Chloroflexota bacterium]
MPPTPRLLEIRTPALLITFYGSASAPHGTVAQGGSPHFSVESSTNAEVIVHLENALGHWSEWEPGHAGPAFFEATAYRVVIEDLVGSRPPRFTHRDPTLLDNVDRVPNHAIVAGTLNFRQQLGRSTFKIAGDTEQLRVTIEVFPTKLDYATDYEEILDEVSAGARALALEYLRATYRGGATTPQHGATDLEWLTLVRNEVDRLESALNYLEQHPHRALDRTVQPEQVERIGRPSRSTIRAIARGRGAGQFVEVVPGVQARSKLPSRRAVETLDTPEHRWLRQQLIGVQQRLGRIFRDAQAQLRPRNDGRPQPRRTAELREITRLQERLARLLEGEAIAAATTTAPSDFASLTLLGQPGYREAYRALVTLRLGLSVHGDDVDLSVKDLDQLYEVWCFLRICRLLAVKADQPPRLTGVIRPRAVGGLRVALRQGRSSAVELILGEARLIVLYNQTYPGLTGTQKPDIVIEVHHAGWPRMFIVFDAKYRLDATDEYVASFGGPGAPVDAVNALHRYRDAIVLAASADQALGRPVVKGAALFPLTAGDEFKSHKLWRSLESLGIGALPFLPDSTALVEDWIDTLLSASPAELAEPGPPFSALEYKRALPG